MKMYQYKNGSEVASIKDADVKLGIVTGYFSSFGNKDADGDVIVKGAFAKTISENGPQSAQPRVKHLLNHDVTKPIGKILVLQEDLKGLYYESKVGSHTLGQDYLKMVDSGLITEHSIGFRTIKEDKKSDANYMTELKLWEGSSLTAWGSNPETPITGMKGLDLETINVRIKALDKFCRNSTATDETIDLLLIEIKQLQQFIIESNQAAVKAPDPQVVRDWSEITNLIN